MLRRLMLAALALCALLALAGCGANQLMAPQVETAATDKPTVLGKNQPASGPRLPEMPEDAGWQEGDGVDAGGAGADTLFWAGDPVR